MKDRLLNYHRNSVAVSVAVVTILIVVSYGLGILLVVPLNALYFAGFPLGFLLANLGFTFVAVVMYFVYALIMAKLDRKYEIRE